MTSHAQRLSAIEQHLHAIDDDLTQHADMLPAALVTEIQQRHAAATVELHALRRGLQRDDDLLETIVCSQIDRSQLPEPYGSATPGSAGATA